MCARIVSQVIANIVKTASVEALVSALVKSAGVQNMT